MNNRARHRLAEQMQSVKNTTMPDLAPACPVTLEILTMDVGPNVSETPTVRQTWPVFDQSVRTHVQERAEETQFAK